MFNLSTDLRQFFTTDHVPDKLEPNTYEKFFINALSYTSSKAIDDLTIAFEEDESNDLIQNFQEIDLLDEHVFPDVIDYEFEEVILSPFFDRNEFAVDGFETLIEGWEYPDLNFGVANEALEIMANVSKKERHNTELLQIIVERKEDDCDYKFTSNALISALSNTLKTKTEVIM